MKVAESELLMARILVVDDQEANIELLVQMLIDAGYTNVSATQNPCEVGALHKKFSFDLILLDLQMPVMDGFKVMEALKTEDAEDFLPVLVITAEPGHKLRALQSGARDFVSKPFDLLEVKTRIRNMLEVRLLYVKLAYYNQALEWRVEERTAELRASEARYRSLTELASDWYWEQDNNGNFTKVFGPVMEMLGIQVQPSGDDAPLPSALGWNEEERDLLRASIAARQPFLDFVFSRTHADGSKQWFQVSGEPMFDLASRFTGYRGIGVELTARTD